MGVPLASVLELLEEMIPPRLAESWDNVGLQLGDPRADIKRIWVALDPAAEVVRAACRQGVDLLVTHHPLIFKPLPRIDLATPDGVLIRDALRSGLAIYAAHTNFDRLADGLNELLAHRMGLLGARPLEVLPPAEGGQHGLGRIGRLPKPMPLAKLAGEIKARLGLSWVRMAGRADLAVDCVALCSGSGSGLLDLFFGSDAQVYVSGDLRYHDARAVIEAGRGLIDIGHFTSEHLMVAALAQRLEALLAERNMKVTVVACDMEKDPFVLV